MRTKNLFNPKSNEPFVLSRSKLEDFINCPRCFYMDRKLGIPKPETPSFQLNKAVDELLKREFDEYRKRKEPHPIMKENGIDAIPFDHKDLPVWRENFKGIRYHDPESNFIITGAVDDVWQKPNGDLIVLDYKATWSTKEATLDSEWRQAWKRQLEIYQWLFKKNGFSVSKEGYFVYCNALVDENGFNHSLRFDIKILPYISDDSWVSPKLLDARACLSGDTIPEPAATCDYCAYKKASATTAATFKNPARFS
ncbi:MAG: PD-(D/E)XK nuclease family protein [Candidatus Omnitrophica bacterium]|nr:PD-(D/E)XK nuclease family protein [Candidatus Omnitrophota bacterium]